MTHALLDLDIEGVVVGAAIAHRIGDGLILGKWQKCLILVDRACSETAVTGIFVGDLGCECCPLRILIVRKLIDVVTVRKVTAVAADIPNLHSHTEWKLALDPERVRLIDGSMPVLIDDAQTCPNILAEAI